MEIYPVVHINDPKTATRQASRAIELGADGIFLIDHQNTSPDDTFHVFDNLKAETLPIGVNLLGYSAYEAGMLVSQSIADSKISKAPDALWVDDTLEVGWGRPSDFMTLRESAPELRAMRYFGGAAFKYTQTFTDDPKLAAREAARLEKYVDVVTTSGSGTGCAAPISKISAMKQQIQKPLALASGVSIENIQDYFGSVDYVLAASSVETAPYSGVFDESKLADFITKVHSL